MTTSSREESPDWLREFQTPVQTITTLSSSSNSDSLAPKKTTRKGPSTVFLSDSEEESSKNTPKKGGGTGKEKRQESSKNTPKKGRGTVKEESQDDEKPSSAKKTRGKKSERKSLETPSKEETSADPTRHPLNSKMEEDVEEAIDKRADEEPPQKRRESKVSSSLPLVFADKIQRSKALLECEGEDLDLSGDVGAVGRLIVSKSSTKQHDILVDLKGTIYKTTIIPSTTFCVVNCGQTEAKELWMVFSLILMKMETK
eukprot:TRINITY_DN14800_c0_g1_i6.p1 TRINITY_DN14800_c0_g1~~TRINITY_DN14800_c0_g1_i6.p1  ORF type:complete len:257 (-),score=59.33 TRINITY_DN14800_c0_g1_i6:552-1322(-)